MNRRMLSELAHSAKVELQGDSMHITVPPQYLPFINIADLEATVAKNFRRPMHITVIGADEAGVH